METATNLKSLRDKVLVLINYFLVRPRLLTLFLALIALGVAAVSVLLTAWLKLNPCYLCIVQRTLAVLVALLLGLVVVVNRRAFTFVLLPLVGLLALGGMTAGAFQSYEQWYPAEVTCMASQPNILEQAVDWLGNQYPNLFMATGFCEDKELEIFGLSLANWSFLCFCFFAMATFWLLLRQIRGNNEVKACA